MKNENDVKAKVKEILKEAGWFNWPNAAGPWSIQGLSDRMSLFVGVFFAIECKYGYNPLRPSQHSFLRSVQENGGISLVITDKNVYEFRGFVANLVSHRRYAAPTYESVRFSLGGTSLEYRPPSGADLRQVPRRAKK